MTKSERLHLQKIAELPCIVCGNWPVQVHHTDTGMGRRKDHFKTIPLCFTHHQGKDGLHTIGKKAWQAKHGAESELLEQVRKGMEESYA